MRALGLDVTTGDFAENITTSGIELVSLPVGSRLQIGETLLEVTQDRQGMPYPLRHLLPGR